MEFACGKYDCFSTGGGLFAQLIHSDQHARNCALFSRCGVTGTMAVFTGIAAGGGVGMPVSVVVGVASVGGVGVTSAVVIGSGSTISSGASSGASKSNGWMRGVMLPKRSTVTHEPSGITYAPTSRSKRGNATSIGSLTWPRTLPGRTSTNNGSSSTKLYPPLSNSMRYNLFFELELAAVHHRLLAVSRVRTVLEHEGHQSHGNVIVHPVATV